MILGRFLVGLAGLMVSATATAADNAPQLEFAFEETALLAPTIHVGKTPIGERNIAPITGGKFEGPGLRGTIMPGGWDWQLTRGDGCMHLKADYMLRTEDGVVINVLNQGIACPEALEKNLPLHSQAVFEAPLGKYEWLNRSSFIGVIMPAKVEGKDAVHIRFYKVK